MGEWEDNQFRCGDIIERDADGRIIFSGPRFLRCANVAECGRLLTIAERAEGPCKGCGGVRFVAARRLTDADKAALLGGQHTLLDWELKYIFPEFRDEVAYGG